MDEHAARSGVLEHLDDVVRGAAGDDIAERLRFVAELDALRLVERRSYVAQGVRRENSGEHSWHVATMALVLAPLLGDVSGEVSIDRVVRMLLLHDVVEIDAGDVPVYDTARRAAKESEERAAADRLYGLLPEATGAELRALWDEYEQHETPEARAAAALDRLAPLLLNWMSRGTSWRELGVRAAQVRAVNLPVADAVSPRLGTVVRALIDDAVRQGWLPE
jgi:putative hydrolase of HD superfamily